VTQPTAHIVDDDEGVRYGLAAYLTVEGFFTRSYDDGWQFIKEAPDISNSGVILDIHAPGTCGPEMQAYLEQRHSPATTVIVLTRSIYQRDVPRFALQVGASILDKPFIAEDLSRIFSRLLSLSQ
jgi:FixJ family two-component response regulator